MDKYTERMLMLDGC